MNLTLLTDVLWVQSQEHRPNHVGTAGQISFRLQSPFWSPRGSFSQSCYLGGLGISIPVSAIWSGKSFITQGVASDYVLQK